MSAILIAKQREYMDMIERDRNVSDPFKKVFRNIKPSELLCLATAIKIVIDAKHKSLLINDWSVQIAEKSAQDSMNEQDKDVIDVNPEESWSLVLKGGEKVTNKELQEFIIEYYDPPFKDQEHLDGTDS
jgi:hypothetical protein